MCVTFVSFLAKIMLREKTNNDAAMLNLLSLRIVVVVACYL